MSTKCNGCKNGQGFPVPFSMAFQPIVDLTNGRVYGHEALVRGPSGEGAGTVLSTVSESNRYMFDQQCRKKAIHLATTLGIGEADQNLSINFMPNAVYEPLACIRVTLETAMRTGFPLRQIIFEFTENESLDPLHILHILRSYREMGFKTAIDDFGAGHSGLNLLAKFQPDIVKLDMDLIRGIDTDMIRRTMVGHIVRMLRDIGVIPLCEGIETLDELKTVQDLGVDLVQGYLIAKPAFESLAVTVIPSYEDELRQAG